MIVGVAVLHCKNRTVIVPLSELVFLPVKSCITSDCSPVGGDGTIRISVCIISDNVTI